MMTARSSVLLLLALGACSSSPGVEPLFHALETGSAAEAMEAKREAGTYDGLEFKRICEDCCHAHGLSGVDPGPCECGDLGLDVFLK